MRVHETIETCGPGEQSILKSFVNRLELALSGWFGSHRLSLSPAAQNDGGVGAHGITR